MVTLGVIFAYAFWASMSNDDPTPTPKNTISEYDLLKPNDTSNDPTEDESTDTTDDTDTEQESNFIKDYQNSKIPQQTIDASLVDLGTNGPTDCFEMYNGDTGGGDLLSTLIVSDELQRNLKINNYRPPYLEELEQKVTSSVHTQFNSDLYAFKVCHLGNNSDIIAGHLWPKGQSPIVQEGTFSGTPNPNFGIKRALAIRYGDKVNVYDNIKVLDNTATGAEVTPCSATSEENGVRWKCFVGMEKDPNGNVIGNRVKEYLFSFEGGAPKTWEGVKDQNGEVIGAPKATTDTPEENSETTPENTDTNIESTSPEASQPTVITADSVAARTQADQIKFQSCGGLALYANQPWYSEMEASAARISLDLNKINQGCHSQNGNIVTLITDQLGAPFNVYRYDILTQKTELANQDEATRTHSPSIPAQKFGKRIDNTIFIQGSTSAEGCNHTGNYVYDFVNNVIKLQDTTNSCE